jgi:putative DNA base modification enzyme with NMAD domain
VKALLVRVGIDLSDDGHWNGPVDPESLRFGYVPIVETKFVRQGMERFYDELCPPLTAQSFSLPLHLHGRQMHLDPDFSTLTYGDQGRRAKQIQQLGRGDLLVFYASLRPTSGAETLVYALIGIFVVGGILLGTNVKASNWHLNAHTRRYPGPTDIVVHAQKKNSGRLATCIPIGEYRERAYRVRRELLTEWGGLSVKNGYLQRSARLPEFLDPRRFSQWLAQKGNFILQANN